MANKSNWKGSEAKAAKLFPGARRRTRVGGGTYAETADDVIWGDEVQLIEGRTPRVVKLPLGPCSHDPDVRCEAPHPPPVYIEVKKRAKFEAVTMIKIAEKKYKGRVALVLHAKHDPRQFVMVDDAFFAELIRAWCEVCNLFVAERQRE